MQVYFEILVLLIFFVFCQWGLVFRHGYLAKKGWLEPSAKASPVGTYVTWAFISAAISVFCASASSWVLDRALNDALLETTSATLSSEASLEFTQARVNEAAMEKLAAPKDADRDALLRMQQGTEDNLLKADAALHSSLQSLMRDYQILRSSDSIATYLGNLFLVMGGGISAAFFAMALDAQRKRHGVRHARQDTSLVVLDLGSELSQQGSTDKGNKAVEASTRARSRPGKRAAKKGKGVK